MSLEEAELFTSDNVTSAIKSCRNSRAYGPVSLSIYHLKNLGPLATEHLTALYNDSLGSCRLPSIWKTSLVILIPNPGKDSSQGTSYKPISLLCPAAKDSRCSSYPLPTNISHQLKIKMASDQDTRIHLPSFSSQQTMRQASTSGNHRTVCVAIDLTAVFDTVSHDILISKIAGSSLPPPSLDGCPAICEDDKLQLASEVSSQARELSAPASLKDPSCHLHCSTIT